MKKAQSLIEYTLILILISAVAISTLNFLGKKMSSNKDKQYNPKSTVIESMDNYCKIKGMVYDQKKEICVPDEQKKDEE